MQAAVPRWSNVLTLITACAVLACDGSSPAGLANNGPDKQAVGGKPGTPPDTSIVTTPPPPPKTGPGPVVRVQLSSDTLMLLVGWYGHIDAQGLNAKGEIVAGRPVTWTISNQAVATVSDTGLVHAVAVGDAILAATIDGKSASARVTVFPGSPAPVTSFDISGTVLAPLVGTDTTRTQRIAGATLSLFRLGGTAPSLVATTTSDANGAFGFKSLASASYRIHVAPPAGSPFATAELQLDPPYVGNLTLSVLLPRSP